MITALVSPLAARYIAANRDRLAPLARPLSSAERGAVQNYFTVADLERARIVVADPLPVAEPPFAGMLRGFGFTFPGLALTSAITLDWVIACRYAMPPALLFHELVHVVQFRLLGVSLFARYYVRGFVAKRSYRAIPLESCAFELEERFVAEGRPFPVEAEVAKRLEGDRF